jgi:hypothetical protein
VPIDVKDEVVNPGTQRDDHLRALLWRAHREDFGKPLSGRSSNQKSLARYAELSGFSVTLTLSVIKSFAEPVHTSGWPRLALVHNGHGCGPADCVRTLAIHCNAPNTFQTGQPALSSAFAHQPTEALGTASERAWARRSFLSRRRTPRCDQRARGREQWCVWSCGPSSASAPTSQTAPGGVPPSRLGPAADVASAEPKRLCPTEDPGQ